MEQERDTEAIRSWTNPAKSIQAEGEKVWEKITEDKSDNRRGEGEDNKICRRASWDRVYEIGIYDDG